LDAYAFGRHEGDLPVRLLGRGAPGNGIRAIAHLDGREHTVFVALDVPDVDGAHKQMLMMSESGVTTDGFVVSCGSESCLDMLMNIVSRVADAAGFLIYLYLRLVVSGRVEILPTLMDELGAEAVGAITDGQGTVIIEVGGHDREELEAIARRVLAEPYVDKGAAHYAVAKHHA